MAASSRPSRTCALPFVSSSPATTPSGWSRRTGIAAQPRCAPPGRRRPSAAPHNAAYCPDSRVRYTSQLPVVSVVGVQWTTLPLDLAVPSDGNLVVPCEPCPAIHEVPPVIEVLGPDREH